MNARKFKFSGVVYANIWAWIFNKFATSGKIFISPAPTRQNILIKIVTAAGRSHLDPPTALHK